MKTNFYKLLFPKSKFFLLVAIFFIALTGVAQVTIPSANTNTVSNRKPFGSFFGFERTAAIYTVAELGLVPGTTINNICFYVNAVTTPADAPVTIYLSTTNATTFTASTFSSEITGATTVFTGTITGASLVANSWRCVTLTTPFTYTGDNLKVMVQTDFGGAGSDASGTSKQFRWSAGASQTWQQDNTMPTGNGTVSTTSRPNIQIGNTPPIGSGTLQFSSGSYNANEGTSPTITVNRIGGITGTVSVQYATSNGTAIAPSDYTAVSGVLTWADQDGNPKTFVVPILNDFFLESSENIVVTLSNPSGATITGTNPSNITINNILPPLNGTYTLGTGGYFDSLTNTGGLFESINNTGAIAGPVTINIISDLTGETGTFALNEFSGGFPLVIKPLGTARTITGANTGALIRLNGADSVTINGSITEASVGSNCTTGGDETLRQLTIINTNSGTSTGVIALQTGTNGAQNNTIKNVKIQGIDPITSLLGIAIGGIAAGTPGADNDNILVENCSIKKVLFGIYSAGENATNPSTGNIITKNDLSATGIDRVRRMGIVVFNQNGVQITQNNIGGIDNNDSNDAIGIALGTLDVSINNTISGGISNAVVANNKIAGVAVTGTSDYSAAGIAIAGIPGSPNSIHNNMISGITSAATTPDIVAGIFVMGTGGTNTKLYYNTIALTGDRGTIANQMPSYGIAITSINSLEEIKNNIVTNTQTSSGGVNAKSYALGLESNVFTNFNFDYNDYWTSGSNTGGFRSGSLGAGLGTDYATLPLWATAIGDDVNSVAIAPVFVSANDLHLTTAGNTSLLNLGTPVTITNDFDCETRNTTPDMGADEVNILATDTFIDMDFSYYPNPTKGVMNFNSKKEIKFIQVINMLGQEMMSKEINERNFQLDFSNLIKGSYFIKLTNEATVKTIQIIKN